MLEPPPVLPAEILGTQLKALLKTGAVHSTPRWQAEELPATALGVRPFYFWACAWRRRAHDRSCGAFGRLVAGGVVAGGRDKGPGMRQVGPGRIAWRIRRRRMAVDVVRWIGVPQRRVRGADTRLPRLVGALLLATVRSHQKSCPADLYVKHLGLSCGHPYTLVAPKPSRPRHDLLHLPPRHLPEHHHLSSQAPSCRSGDAGAWIGTRITPPSSLRTRRPLGNIPRVT